MNTVWWSRPQLPESSFQVPPAGWLMNNKALDLAFPVSSQMPNISAQQFGVQCLAQGHFILQPGDQTCSLLIAWRPTPPHEPQSLHFNASRKTKQRLWLVSKCKVFINHQLEILRLWISSSHNYICLDFLEQLNGLKMKMWHFLQIIFADRNKKKKKKKKNKHEMKSS